MSHVDFDSSNDTKIAPRSVRIAAGVVTVSAGIEQASFRVVVANPTLLPRKRLSTSFMGSLRKQLRSVRITCEHKFASGLCSPFVLGELRKRVEAGVRFWPEPPGLDEIAAQVRTIIEHTAATLAVAEPEPEEPGYWWQRM